MSCTLVLLPGMDGTGELFAPFTDILRQIPTQVVRYPDVPLDYSAHEEFVRAQLPRAGSFVVLGESFSGPIAVSLAASPPVGMRGYVLCASFIRCPRTLLRVLRPLIGLITYNRVHPLLAQYLLMGGSGSPALLDAHQAAIRGLSNAALAARMHAIARIDVSDRLARVRMPGLFLRATRDCLIPRAAARRFSRIATSARLVDIEGPHMLVQTNPTAAAQALRVFLDEVESA